MNLYCFPFVTLALLYQMPRLYVQIQYILIHSHSLYIALYFYFSGSSPLLRLMWYNHMVSQQAANYIRIRFLFLAFLNPPPGRCLVDRTCRCPFHLSFSHILYIYDIVLEYAFGPQFSVGWNYVPTTNLAVCCFEYNLLYKWNKALEPLW